jgi:uroporphyrin-III C-methyltransferase/precorrin-2 dehydrogenase/sirohydrochlorin ferrochelatase
MGLVGLKDICESLIAHGRAPATPVALIERGTTQQQRVLIADLASIAEVVAAQEVHAPTLFIVGDVVRLHENLKWFKVGV